IPYATAVLSMDRAGRPCGGTSRARSVSAIPPTENSAEPPLPVGTVEPGAEQTRAVHVLKDENKRLADLLELKRKSFPRLLAARVVNRDPSRWFQEILLDKGVEQGVHVDDPVIVLSGIGEASVGR